MDSDAPLFLILSVCLSVFVDTKRKEKETKSNQATERRYGMEYAQIRKNTIEEGVRLKRKVRRKEKR